VGWCYKKKFVRCCRPNILRHCCPGPAILQAPLSCYAARPFKLVAEDWLVLGPGLVQLDARVTVPKVGGGRSPGAGRAQSSWQC
jgi:hypothetical protein